MFQHNPKTPTQLADEIVRRVLDELQGLGRVPRDFVRGQGTRPIQWTLSRAAATLFGRDAEVAAVIASLRQHSAAVIWGGPGEGKSTIAREAAAQLREREKEVRDLSAFEIDMRGAHGKTKSMLLSSTRFACPPPLLRCLAEAADLTALAVFVAGFVGVEAMPDSVINDPGKYSQAGLALCQQHTSAKLAPWYLQWQVCFESGYHGFTGLLSGSQRPRVDSDVA